MSRGKYLSLPEARKKRQLERFAKEHPSEGDAGELERIVREMAKKPESGDQTSRKKKSSDD